MANAYAGKVPISYKYLQVQMIDISSATKAFVCCPFQGELIGYRGARSATTTGTAAITLEVNATAYSRAAGSWTADTDQGQLSVDFVAIPVADGDVIELVSDAGSANTSIGTFTLIFRE